LPALCGGGGGSGGAAGTGSTAVTNQCTFPSAGRVGGAYGGGGGSGGARYFVNGCYQVCTNSRVFSSGGSGSGGAVRIIWPGNTRSFPSTNTGNL
jgi:hypothetical protein